MFQVLIKEQGLITQLPVLVHVKILGLLLVVSVVMLICLQGIVYIYITIISPHDTLTYYTRASKCRGHYCFFTFLAFHMKFPKKELFKK